MGGGGGGGGGGGLMAHDHGKGEGACRREAFAISKKTSMSEIAFCGILDIWRASYLYK